MSQVRLHITAERLDELTLDDWIGLEAMKFAQLRDALAKFVVNGDGSYLPEAEARAVLGRLRTSEVREVIRQFRERVNALAINPTTGGE